MDEDKEDCSDYQKDRIDIFGEGRMVWKVDVSKLKSDGKDEYTETL